MVAGTQPIEPFTVSRDVLHEPSRIDIEPAGTRGIGHDTDDGSGITVTEIGTAGDGSGGLLGSVMGVYEQHGHDAGYRRAVADMLVSLLALSEAFLREQPAPTAANLRPVVFAFERYLDQHLAGGRAAGRGFVEGGLGI